MNGLFRFACLSLCWGLFVAVGLAAIVMGQGIPPDVLLTFKETSSLSIPKQDIIPGRRPAPLDQGAKGPEFFARAETASRLDVVQDTAMNLGHRTVSTPHATRTSSTPSDEKQFVLSPPDTEMPLPPDPEVLAPSIGHVEETSSSEPPVAGPNLGVPNRSRPDAIGPTLGLPSEQATSESPTEPPASPIDKDVLIPEPPSKSHSVRQNRVQGVAPRVRNATNPAIESRMPETRSRTSSVPAERNTGSESASQVPHSVHSAEIAPVAPVDSTFVDRLVQMQHQLDQMAAAQQQARQASRTQFEMTQMFQQRKLEEKLEGIEQGLRELRTAQAVPVPIPQATIPPRPETNGHEQVSTSTPIHATTPLVREEKPGADGQQRFSVNSQGGDLRELLDTLAQKANFNLVLAINVEGDVELSLRNATADEALEAIKKTTGYVVEKSGQRVYVGPPGTKTFQRQEFLPPIVISRDSSTLVPVH